MIAPELSDTPIGLLSPLVPTAVGRASHEDARANGTAEDAWRHTIEALVCLQDLEDDWDGQGAQRVDAANVARSIELVRCMSIWPQALPPDQVVPGVTGEVLLIWQRTGVLVEAEISDPEKTEWLLTVEGQPARQWTTGHDATWLIARLPDVSLNPQGTATL